MKVRNSVGDVLLEVIVGEDTRVQLRLYRLVGGPSTRTWVFQMTYNIYGGFDVAPSPLEALVREASKCESSNRYLKRFGFYTTHTREILFPGEVLLRAINGNITEVASDISLAGVALFKAAFTYTW